MRTSCTFPNQFVLYKMMGQEEIASQTSQTDTHTVACPGHVDQTQSSVTTILLVIVIAGYCNKYELSLGISSPIASLTNTQDFGSHIEAW